MKQEKKEKKTWEPTTRTQELSKFLYRAPEPKYIIPFILLFSLLFGLLIDLGIGGLIYGLLLLGVPAFLSAWVSTLFVEAFGGKFYYRRSFLTSVVGVFIIGFILIFGHLIRPIIDVHWRYLVIYGYSLTLSMRYLVIRSTCLNYHRYSFIVSSAQTFFALIIHAILSVDDLGYLDDNQFLSIQEAFFGMGTSLILFLASLIFVEIVNAPLKTDVGISGTDLLGFFLSYMIEGTKEIESLFIPLQEEYSVPISIMAVKRSETGTDVETETETVIETAMESVTEAETETVAAAEKESHYTDTSESNKKPFHALIISPSVHPGPVGTIGGGNLPMKLTRSLSDLADHILVPHGAATNDCNPASSSECTKIIDAVRELANSISDEDFGNTVSHLQMEQKNITVNLLKFQENGIMIIEPFPSIFDDLSMEMYKNVSWVSKYHGIQEIMLIDAHNNSERHSTAVHVGDSISLEIENMVKDLSTREIAMYPLSIGFGSAIPTSMINGLGPKGVQSMVVRVKDQRTALILFDANNMLPEVRTTLLHEAQKLVDNIIILTADNHAVNATLGGYNPLGFRCDINEIIPLMKDSLEQAIKDLSRCKVVLKSGLVERINIFGFGNTNRLVATINSTMAVFRRAAIPCILFAIASSALIYYLV